MNKVSNSTITKVLYSARHMTYYVKHETGQDEVVTPENYDRWSELFNLIRDWPMELLSTMQVYANPDKERQ